ncbi:MAG: hypothetical protein ACKOBR_08585, partial [Actinomycetota bacterium]
GLRCYPNNVRHNERVNVSGVVVERVNAVVARLYPDATDGLDSAARPSDRADAQINIALGLANKVGKKPRDVAQHIIEQLDVRDVCTKVEVAGPGFLNLTFADSPHSSARCVVARPIAWCAAGGFTATCGDRLLGPECGEGNARRTSAFDGDW